MKQQSLNASDPSRPAAAITSCKNLCGLNLHDLVAKMQCRL